MPGPATPCIRLWSPAPTVRTREAVEAAIGDPAQVLLDVRVRGRYSGERFWPSGATADAGRTGHSRAPSASRSTRSAPKTGTSRPRGAAPHTRAGGVTKDKTVITYCTIGNRASEAWFALTHLLDYPDARVYYGSWVEWGNATDTPIESQTRRA